MKKTLYLQVAFGLALTLAPAHAQNRTNGDAADNAIADSATEATTPELPPANPPQVSFANGRLAIDANDSTLADVLKEVEQKTGAHVDMPPDAGKERVVVHLGPGVPRDVISDLLYGLPFNYVIEGSDANPNDLQSLLLTPRKALPSTGSSASSAVRTAAVPHAYSPYVRSSSRPESVQQETDNPASESAVEQAQSPIIPASGTLEVSDLPAPPTGNHNDNRQVSAVATDAVLATVPPTNTDQSAAAQPNTIDQMSNTLNRLYQVRQQLQERQNQANQPRPNSQQ